MSAEALGKLTSHKTGELAGVLCEVANGVAGFLDFGRAMGPPALVIYFSEVDAAGNPYEDVVMGASLLCELSHPEITENLTRKPFGAGSSDIEVAPHPSQKLANVTRAATASISVGEREHVPGPTEPRCFRFFIVQPRGRNNGLLQPLRPCQQWVYFDRYAALLGCLRTTCFIRDKPKGSRCARPPG